MAGTHSYNTGFSFGGAISYVKDITGPDISISATKATHLKSASGFHEYVSGLGDGGSLTLNLLFDKTQLAALYGYLRGSGQAWSMTFPESSIVAGSGILTGLGHEVPEDDMIAVPVTIKVSGKPTFTAG